MKFEKIPYERKDEYHEVHHDGGIYLVGNEDWSKSQMGINGEVELPGIYRFIKDCSDDGLIVIRITRERQPDLVDKVMEAFINN